MKKRRRLGGVIMKKVIDIEERIPSMREKRRRTTNRKFIFILSVFVIALLAILYFQSSFSKIKVVTVNGANLHGQEFYKEQIELFKDKPIWGFSTQAAEDSLKEVDTVKDASISRKWFRGVAINITEWETIAYIEDKENYNIVLENGYVFSGDEVLPEEKAPVLIDFDNEDSLKRIVSQLQDLDKNVYHLVSEIILEGDSKNATDLTVYMDDGYEVRAIISTFADQMAYYLEITAQLHDYEKGVIDMEVGTFFTPFSKVYGPREEDEEVVEESE